MHGAHIIAGRREGAHQLVRGVDIPAGGERRIEAEDQSKEMKSSDFVFFVASGLTCVKQSLKEH